jgi:hypothetical protein
MGKRRIPGTDAATRPQSRTPLSQLSGNRATHLLTTAHAAEPCHARPHAYMQRSRSTAPCFPPPSAPPASCRVGGLQCRRFQTCGIRTQAPPRTSPESGAQIHNLRLPIHAASLHRQRPLPPPPTAFPSAEWGRKVDTFTRPQGLRCAAAGVAQVHEVHPGVGPSQRGGSEGSGLPRAAPRPSPSPNPGRFFQKINTRNPSIHPFPNSGESGNLQ